MFTTTSTIYSVRRTLYRRVHCWVQTSHNLFRFLATILFPSLPSPAVMTPLKLIFLLTTLTLLCLATSADPSPRLYASSNVLSRSGDVVTLSWKGLGGIAAVISVGVTSYDGKTVASIGQFIVETSDGELQTPLVNMRQPYIFSLMKGNLCMKQKLT